MENTSIFEAGALTGRQQAFAMIASKCTYAQAVLLKEIHATRAYQELGLTWEQYCSRHAGMGRGAAETIIKRLDEFGEAYFRLAALVRISPDTFRQIADRLTAETIDLDGEQIPLTSDNAAKIRAGIRRLQDEVRRLKNHFRVPTRITEFGVRIDDVLQAVTTRARLGRALPHDEAAALRSLANHVLNKWTEIAEMLKPPTDADLR
jgi:hypothetical protein